MTVNTCTCEIIHAPSFSTHSALDVHNWISSRLARLISPLSVISSAVSHKLKILCMPRLMHMHWWQSLKSLEVDISDLPPTATVPLVSDVASKVVNRFTIVSEAVLRLPVEQLQSGTVPSRVPSHGVHRCLEWRWWCESSPVLEKCCCSISLPGDEPSTHWGSQDSGAVGYLSPHFVHQRRFVNTHGWNIPCDLHNEHVNKQGDHPKHGG